VDLKKCRVEKMMSGKGVIMTPLHKLAAHTPKAFN
jgi:hypothetical protein